LDTETEQFNNHPIYGISKEKNKKRKLTLEKCKNENQRSKKMQNNLRAELRRPKRCIVWQTNR
jgi:hypothetical protein